MAKLWVVNCQENRYPGMWQRWFINQCVAVGWPPGGGYQLNVQHADRDWNTARNALLKMKIGDRVAVALRNLRVGRIGEITGKAVRDDDWNPLVPVGPGIAFGEMGRRILVRWDLTMGPDNFDMVVKLPSELNVYSRSAVSARSVSFLDVVGEMNNPANWVSLRGRFQYEKALSDYIANYPNRLEDGLFPHPNKKVRELVFSDRRRADVLLMDKKQRPVVVECKQHSPSIYDIQQLRGYMRRLLAETGVTPRGILVHAGAPKLSPEVETAAMQEPCVEVVSYVLDVRFTRSASLAQ